MEGVELRGKSYVARKRIPDDLRAVFGKREFKKALGTRDSLTAHERAVPILRGWDHQIEHHRNALKRSLPPTVKPAPIPIATVDPAKAQQAIERWRIATIRTAHLAHFNAPKPDHFGNAAVARSDFRYTLNQPKPWETIPSFDQNLVDALKSEGMAISPSHPALEGLRPWFAQAWREVERFTVLFERGQFDKWLEVEEEILASTPAPSLSQQMNGSVPVVGAASVVKAMRMRELLERFCEIEQPNEENDIRYEFGRLIEFTGDVPITEIGSAQLQDFRVAVARFPRTRQPDIIKLPFFQIIAEHGVDPSDPEDEDDEPDGYSPLSPTTVWKWCVNIKRVFQFALESKPTPLTENPAAKLPKKPKESQRGKIRGFNEREIAALFTTPLFQGCDQVWGRTGATHGYRTTAGDLLVKDARYWLPIVALWQGCRLEEIGFAAVEEIRTVEGIQCLDLRQRTDNRIKNNQSRRLLPIHPKLIELGFIAYVDQQRANGSDRLFPELPHDLRKVALPKRSTRGFSKWWGLWMTANGFPERDINFHSFRHTFKTVCHDLMPEPVHDYLTGHKHARGATAPSVGRGYIHTNVRQAYEAICKVDYPTFPPLP